MNWINSLWLGSGIGLGLAIGQLFSRFKTVEKRTEKPIENPTPLESAEHKRLELAYHRALELSQFKAGFLARTSHELRSPLNGVIGVHQLILADLCESPEEEREFIAQAHESALKLLHLLDEVINVSKADYGSATLAIQPVSLAMVLEDTYGLTHLVAENRNLKFQIAIPDESLYVLADPKWLQYVLVTLISSAISLMHDGAITVTVRSDENFAHLLITDDRPAESWKEAIDLLTPSSPSTPIAASQSSWQPSSKILEEAHTPGFSLLLTQTVMELMNGRLTLLAIPSLSNPTETHIQCSIPLVVPEVA
jgi:signal transduction histidine kinase